MSIITAICILGCVFIAAVFTFFTIVYRSELDREREIRSLMLKEQKQLTNFVQGSVPVIIMEPKQEPSLKDIKMSGNKKDIN